MIVEYGLTIVLGIGIHVFRYYIHDDTHYLNEFIFCCKIRIRIN